MENVITLFPHRQIGTDLDTMLIDFISLGIFHETFVRGAMTREQLFQAVKSLRSDESEVVDCGDGWFVVLNNQTIAMRTLMRIAAVTEDRVIAYDDLAKAIIKMAEWGPEITDNAMRKNYASRWGEYFEILPSTSAIKCLADNLGCTDLGKGCNLSTSRYVIEPSEVELFVLEALELQYDHCAPTSRLCRLIPGTPSRTHLDYAVLKKIPFVLKPSREVNRLIGYEPDPKLAMDQDKPSYLAFRLSDDGKRVLLQYLVSEQNVEGNSFNIPESIRETLHGEYSNVRAKGKIRYDKDGKDARKITGVGKYIRDIYPDYVEGQYAYVLLDREEWKSDVILCAQEDYVKIGQLRSWLDFNQAVAA